MGIHKTAVFRELKNLGQNRGLNRFSCEQFFSPNKEEIEGISRHERDEPNMAIWLKQVSTSYNSKKGFAKKKGKKSIKMIKKERDWYAYSH